MKIEYNVDNKSDNLTLKQIMKQNLQISTALLREIVGSSAVTVNGENIYTNNRVSEGDHIVVDLDKIVDVEIKESRYEKKYIDKQLEKTELDIVYEDEYILAINKEAGMSAHPNSNQQDNTLTEKVYDYYEQKGYNHRIHIVNRLDRNTSGICIFAKHKYVQELISKAMKTDNLKKEYLAIVYGKMEKNHGFIEGKIARKQDSIILREVSEEGDMAKTEYTVEKYNKKKNYSILSVILHTGKTHQIRVHMADIGHPLIGDELYINEAKKKHIIEDICTDIDRQALHARKINMQLNILNMDIEIEAKVPYDIAELL